MLMLWRSWGIFGCLGPLPLDGELSCQAVSFTIIVDASPKGSTLDQTRYGQLWFQVPVGDTMIIFWQSRYHPSALVSLSQRC